MRLPIYEDELQLFHSEGNNFSMYFSTLKIISSNGPKRKMLGAKSLFFINLKIPGKCHQEKISLKISFLLHTRMICIFNYFPHFPEF